jgi:hypothetical protein
VKHRTRQAEARGITLFPPELEAVVPSPEVGAVKV